MEHAADVQPYELLGLDPQRSTDREVRRAYYNLARLSHPDKGGSTEQMIMVQTAYEWVMGHVHQTRDRNETFAAFYDARSKEYDAAQVREPPTWLDVRMEAMAFDPKRFESMAADLGVDAVQARLLMEPVISQRVREALAAGEAVEATEAFWEGVRTELEQFVLRTTSSEPAEVWGAALLGGYGEWMDAPGGEREDVPSAPTRSFGDVDEVVIYKEPASIVLPTDETSATALVQAVSEEDYSMRGRHIAMCDYRRAFQPRALIVPQSHHMKFTEIVSGERLQQLADVTIATPEHVASQPSLRNGFISNVIVFQNFQEFGEAPENSSFTVVHEAKSIFVYSHLLQDFFKYIYPYLKHSFVLLSHNSDGAVTTEYLPYINDINSKVTAWFAQNITVLHPKLHVLPIGIANSQWPHGDIHALCNVIDKMPVKTNFCYFFFNTSTAPAKRSYVARICCGKGLSPSPPLAFHEYLQFLATHKYAICPEGHGVDTHRLWECLYLGVIPIVSRSVNIDMLKAHDLQMVILEDWKDLDIARLETEYPAMSKKVGSQNIHTVACLSKINESINRFKALC